MLLRGNIKISPPAVYRMLKEQGLSNQQERWIALEQQAAKDISQLTEEQIQYIEQCNPCFMERNKIGAYPGEMLAQGTISLGYYKQIGKVYLYFVMDTYSNYLFTNIDTSIYRSGQRAIDLLENAVLPFFQIPGLGNQNDQNNTRSRIHRM